VGSHRSNQCRPRVLEKQQKGGINSGVKNLSVFQAFVLYLAALPWPGMPVEDSDNNNAYLGNVQKIPFNETQLPFGQTELP
jgi:hypothetical protein